MAALLSRAYRLPLRGFSGVLAPNWPSGDPIMMVVRLGSSQFEHIGHLLQVAQNSLTLARGYNS